MTPRFPIPPIEDDFSAQRWEGITRPYGPETVKKLRGSIRIEHTLAQLGARKLWKLLQNDEPARALGALSGGQAVQMAKAGLKAIYCSGWQVAADANLSGQTYPDQSLYPANSVPALVKRLNGALQRADQIEHGEGGISRDWFLPIIADAEAGFGGPLNAFELMKGMIEAGAAGTSRTSFPARRSAATWAGRCSSPRATSSAPWWRPAWQRMSWMCPVSSSPARTRTPHD